MKQLVTKLTSHATTSLRQQSRRFMVTTLLVTVGLLIALATMAFNALGYFKAQAEATALVRLQLINDTVAQAFRRQLDGLDQLSEHLNRIARTTGINDHEAEFSRDRIRGLLADPRFAVASVALLARDQAHDWQAGTEAPDITTLEAMRALRLPPGSSRIERRLLTGQPGQWLLPIVLSVSTPGTTTEVGNAVVSLDGQRLTKILGSLDRQEGDLVVLWHGLDDVFLAGGAPDPLLAVTREVLSPLRHDDPRNAAMVSGPPLNFPRFFVRSKIDGYDLFLSVTTPRDVVMAGFAQTASLIWLFALAIAALIVGGALSALLTHAQFISQEELEFARSELALNTEINLTMRSVLDGLDGGVTLAWSLPNGEWEMAHQNNGIARLLRRSEAELAGVQSVLIFAEPPPSAHYHAEAGAVLRATGEHRVDTQLRCGDGILRWMRFLTRVISRDGDRLECVTLLLDVSVEHAAAQAATLSARLATVGELSAGIAHEMKQPLTVIALAAETTTMGIVADPPSTTDEIVAAQERILLMVDRASEITDHLRAFSRNESQELETISILKTVNGALLLCRPALREARVEVEIDIPGDLPLTLGKQVMVEQVVINLLMNARDSMDAIPANQRRLTIRAALEQGAIVLRVRDSGPGIPADVMPQLFKAFFTTKPVGIGTGLGLSICATIVSACGGTITAANAPDGGAEFTITLPQVTTTIETMIA